MLTLSNIRYSWILHIRYSISFRDNNGPAPQAHLTKPMGPLLHKRVGLYQLPNMLHSTIMQPPISNNSKPAGNISFTRKEDVGTQTIVETKKEPAF